MNKIHSICTLALMLPLCAFAQYDGTPMNKTGDTKKAETAVRTDKYPHSDNDWENFDVLHINRLPSAATFMAYTMSLMNLGMLGLDQALLRFYHEPARGVSGRQMFLACVKLSVLVMVLAGAVASVFFAPPLWPARIPRFHFHKSRHIFPLFAGHVLAAYASAACP